MCSTSMYFVCLCVCTFVCACACVCVCVCVCDVPAHQKHLSDTCCTCMTSDSSQTGLTNTAPRSPGCSDWKPQDMWGHCPLTFIKRGGGSSLVPRPLLYVNICGKFISLVHRLKIEVRSLPSPPPPPPLAIGICPMPHL